MQSKDQNILQSMSNGKSKTILNARLMIVITKNSFDEIVLHKTSYWAKYTGIACSV